MDIYDVPRKLTSDTLPNYPRIMFQYNSRLYDTEKKHIIECMYFQLEHLAHIMSCDISPRIDLSISGRQTRQKQKRIVPLPFEIILSISSWYCIAKIALNHAVITVVIT